MAILKLDYDLEGKKVFNVTSTVDIDSLLCKLYPDAGQSVENEQLNRYESGSDGEH